MGSSQSAFVKSLEIALDGDRSLIATPRKWFYQSRYVKRYNLSIPVAPTVITYPETVEQVAAIVKCAADAGLKVQARGGGHSYANYSLGGGVDGIVVINLENFQQFSMNRTTWRATIGAGMLLGDLTRQMYDNGKRAMSHGTCPKVGIGGHATIGGLGPTSRQFGACLDHVEEIEVVTADGKIQRASETQNQDLFWAMRGAGASFGIVTEFVCRTEPEPGNAIHFSYTFRFRPYKSLAPVFKRWQEHVSSPNISRKFSTEVIFLELGMIISGTFFGTKEEFDEMELDDMFRGHSARRLFIFDDYLSLVAHWAEEGALRLVGGMSSPFYAKSLTFNGTDLIPDHLIDKFLEYLDDSRKGTPVWFVIFDLEGGAINDVAPDATAYAHRDALFYMQSYGVALDFWTGKVSKRLKDFLGGLDTLLKSDCPVGEKFGCYAGYVDPELGKDGPAEYWRYNLPRLEQIKRDVDPNEVFWNPQSVRPAPLRISDDVTTLDSHATDAPEVTEKIMNKNGADVKEKKRRGRRRLTKIHKVETQGLFRRLLARLL